MLDPERPPAAETGMTLPMRCTRSARFPARGVRSARQGFEAGKFAFLDVIDAQRSLLQARTRYLSALSNAYQAATAIDRLLGR